MLNGNISITYPLFKYSDQQLHSNPISKISLYDLNFGGYVNFDLTFKTF